MRFFSVFITLFFTVITATAAEYTIYLPSGPGATNDLVARAVAKSYNKLTGNTLVPINKPGGNMVPAVNDFKNTDQPAMILGNTGIHVFNYYQLTQPLPYNDNDFDHVAFIAWGPQLWYANVDSGIRTPQDLIKKLPNLATPFVAGDNQVNTINMNSVIEKHKLSNVSEVRYKTSGEVTLSTVANQQPVGIGSPTPVIFGQVDANKLVLVGSTLPRKALFHNIEVPSISQELGTPQFSGGYILSLNKKFSRAEAEKIKKDLIAAIQDAESQETFKNIGVYYDPKFGADTTKLILEYRNNVGTFLKK